MKKNIKILFIGNSLTYYNFMPETVRKFFAAAGVNAECVMLTQGGKCMDFHVKQKQVEYNILYGNYDYVVLQGKASDFDPASFVENGKVIYDNFIAKTSAIPVMYVAWSLKGQKKKQPMMTAAYTELAAYTHGLMAPAGEAWQKALRLRPAPDIYRDDGNHPTPAGSYLCAATIFYAITGRDRMLRLPEEGGIYTECGLDRKTAYAFNRIACEKVREYNK